MNVLVVAAHPDDEVLGTGGTIARLAKEGNKVTIAIVTKGWQPLFSESQVQRVRKEAQNAAGILGVADVVFMDLPVTKLKAILTHELNAAFSDLIKQKQPQMVFLPFCSDRHEDHKIVFEACMVALRPNTESKHIQNILCYETVSETHWSAPYVEPGFEPQYWVDIAQTLPVKLRAMQAYASQVQPTPAARSIEALSALAKWRGSIVGMEAAECFYVVRECWHSDGV